VKLRDEAAAIFFLEALDIAARFWTYDAGAGSKYKGTQEKKVVLTGGELVFLVTANIGVR